jgi:peptidoglycan/xylan/chitin deacetylase (PgdA/CDA1 family)
MYHVIADPQPGTTYPELFVSPSDFQAQMQTLHSRGYHAVTLAQVDRYWSRGYALPSKPIVVSFDDGYLSHYTRARPVLSRLGWRGVLNLEVDNVRTAGDISAHQVSALIGDGWEVDSHTISHPDLTTLPPARLRTELVGSRDWLRRRFHVPVDYFCYPAGRFNQSVEAAVKAAGYRLATTTQPGLASPDDPLALDRVRVDRSDGVTGLLRKLAAPGGGGAAEPGAG